MRDVKSAEDRKLEIMAVASGLFAAKGYDHTSISDILEKVGIAKGTLYYHYKSKEEILDGLIEHYGANAIDVAKRIAEDKTIPVIERVLKIILAANMRTGEHEGGAGKEVIAQIQKPQNVLMRQKTKKFTVKAMAPIITGVLAEGMAQGVFHTEYLAESVEMILIYAANVFDDNITELTQTALEGRGVALIYNMERLLGAEAGSLRELSQIFHQGHGPKGDRSQSLEISENPEDAGE